MGKNGRIMIDYWTKNNYPLYVYNYFIYCRIYTYYYYCCNFDNFFDTVRMSLMDYHYELLAYFATSALQSNPFAWPGRRSVSGTFKPIGVVHQQYPVLPLHCINL